MFKFKNSSIWKSPYLKNVQIPKKVQKKFLQKTSRQNKKPEGKTQQNQDKTERKMEGMEREHMFVDEGGMRSARYTSL
jgi:hypothetical protein